MVEALLESVGAGLNQLGLVLCFGVVDRRLVLWVDFNVLAVAEFQFHDDCWRCWVCCGGAVAAAGLVVLGYLGLW